MPMKAIKTINVEGGGEERDKRARSRLRESRDDYARDRACCAHVAPFRQARARLFDGISI